MEQRQTQVQVGAGLQESRLNTELIGFLQKYGSWAVYALLAVVLAYLGKNWWETQQEKARDSAFADFRAASNASNPVSLVKVAEDHAGTAVASMGRIEAVRLYMDAARRGLKPGADVQKPAPEDVLDEAGKRGMIDQASTLIDEILGEKRAPTTLKQQARWFRASIQADLGDTAGAIATMNELESIAKSAGFPDQEIKARERIAALEQLKEVKPLFASADLPEAAREPVVAPGDASAPGPMEPGAMPVLRNAPGVEIKKMTPEEIAQAIKETQPAPAPAPAEPKPN